MSEINKKANENNLFTDGGRLSEHGKIVTGVVDQELHNMFIDYDVSSLTVAELRSLEACMKSMVANIFCEKIHQKLNENK